MNLSTNYNEIQKELPDIITPLTVQSAARMYFQPHKVSTKPSLEQWRTNSAATKRQRRFAGLQHTSPKPAVDSTTRTVHPRKLKAVVMKQRRVSGMKHRVPRLPMAQDLLYRTVHPTKLDALKVGKTKSTVYKRTKDSGKLFRSVSEGTMMWGCPSRWAGGGDVGLRKVITTMSA